MPASSERVFVYGTLRRGGSQHFRMAGAVFVAVGSVSGRVYRIDWYPGLVLDAAAGSVAGEVYDVSAELFARLDEFEGGEYRLVRVRVQAGQEEMENVWVWEWRGVVDGYPRIDHGDWLGLSETD